MNLLNLTKRPLGAFPETSEQMVNLICINALDQAGIEHDKAEYWEQKYNEVMRLLKFMSKHSEIRITPRGTHFISFESIDSNYDDEIYDLAIDKMNLGAKLIELETKEENE